MAGTLGDMKRPDFDFGYFHRVQDIHRYSISALVGEMATDPGTQFFVSLAYVDWFAIIVVERVDPVRRAPNGSKATIAMCCYPYLPFGESISAS